MTLSIDCLRSGTAFEQLKAVWQTLERKDTECTPFSTWAWQSRWWQYIGRERGRLRLLIVRNGSEVVGIVPMFINTVAVKGLRSANTLAFTGDVPGLNVVHHGMVCLPKFRQLIAPALLKHLPSLKGWNKLRFNGLLADSTLAMAALESDHLSFESKASDEAQLPLQTRKLTSWVEYRNEQGARRVKLLSKISAALRQSGECELSICSSRDSFDDGMKSYSRLNSVDTQSTDGDAVEQSESDLFLNDLLKEFYSQDQLWQVTLSREEHIVGVQQYFLWRGELILVQSAFDPELERLSADTFMLAYVIKRAIEQTAYRLSVLKDDAQRYNDFVTQSMNIAVLQYSSSRVRQLFAPVIRPFTARKAR